MVDKFLEVERAIDNLAKSGKMPFALLGKHALSSTTRHVLLHFLHQRSTCTSANLMFAGAPQPHAVFPRHPSVTEFDPRPQAASALQNYYQNQRYAPRPEPNQVEQAKRRMAAQRERELRNYHQEQQYAKNVSGPTSDRSMSPNTGMSEDERRELIARQHRALYGNESTLYTDKNGRTTSQDTRGAGAARDGSPLAFDPYGIKSPGGTSEAAVQMPPRDQTASARSPANNASSPSTNQNSSFGKFDSTQPSARTSSASPSGGSPTGTNNKNGVAPIGTRPAGSQIAIQGLQKRSTTPLPSPLNKGFNVNDQSFANERSTSSASNPQDKNNNNVALAWGSNSGVWGNGKTSLGVQASVWG